MIELTLHQLRYKQITKKYKVQHWKKTASRDNIICNIWMYFLFFTSFCFLVNPIIIGICSFKWLIMYACTLLMRTLFTSSLIFRTALHQNKIKKRKIKIKIKNKNKKTVRRSVRITRRRKKKKKKKKTKKKKKKKKKRTKYTIY